MVRLALILSLVASGASAEIKTVEELEVTEPHCDTCLARQNGKRALRDYLAQKRAEEEANNAKDEEDD